MSAILLVAVIMLLYVPAVGGGFIIDDALLSWGNPDMRSWDGLRRLWLGIGSPDYFPLTSTTFWLEWRLWEQNAAGYRLVNILLHAGSALLLWRILRQLRVPGAWLGGLLFGIHPLAVTSVAWIAERKNTLSLLLVLLSLFCYLRFQDSMRKRWYAAALGSFLLALLAKTSVVMFPPFLLVLTFWRQGCLRKNEYWRTAPFFLLSLVLGLVTVHFQLHRGAGAAPVPYYLSDFLTRVAVAGRALWFYLFQSLVPHRLTVVYPAWKINPSLWYVYLPTLAWVGMLLVAWLWRRRNAWLMTGWVLVTAGTLLLFPVLSFVNMSFHQFSWVSDHLAYLVLPLAATGVAAGITRLWQSPRQVLRGLAGALLVLVLGWWGGQAVGRTSLHGNTEKLWQDQIAKNPQTWVGYSELSGCKLEPWWQAHVHNETKTFSPADIAEIGYLVQTALRLGKNAILYERAGMLCEIKGDSAGAVHFYQESLKIDPQHSLAWFYLGLIAEKAGNLDEAERCYRNRLAAKAQDANALTNLANVLTTRGKADEALALYAQARVSAPRFSDAYINAADLLARHGRLPEADTLLCQALHKLPEDASVRLAAGTLALRLGRLREAETHLARAAELSPETADVFINLGIAQAAGGNPQPALASWQRAAALNPKDPVPHRLAAKALAALGHAEAAQAEMRTAAELAP